MRDAMEPRTIFVRMKTGVILEYENITNVGKDVNTLYLNRGGPEKADLRWVASFPLSRIDWWGTEKPKVVVKPERKPKETPKEASGA